MLTSLDFLQVGQEWPPADPDTKARLRRYDENRHLWKGNHELVFAEVLKRVQDEERKAAYMIVLNFPKRLTKLWRNLLLSEPPVITAGDPDTPEQAMIERLMTENGIVQVLGKSVVDFSRFGDGPLKVRYKDRAIVEANFPGVWFPVVAPDNVGEYIAHVMAYKFEVDNPTILDKKAKTIYVRAEVHKPGVIENRLFEIKDGKIKRELDLANLPPTVSNFAGLQPVEQTGVNDFLVIPISNIATSDEATGEDDYTDLDTILAEIEARFAQVAKILDKHADPTAYGPDSAMEFDETTGEWYWKGGKYVRVEGDEKPPGYMTWDGQLDSAFNQIDRLMDRLYEISETSPAAFGQLKAGLAESGSALKRLLMAPLSKAAIIRQTYDPAVKKALQIAAQLEVKYGRSGSIALKNVSVQWNDGLPIDDKEMSDIMVARKAAGLVSARTAINRMDGTTGKALDDEVKAIEEEKPAVVDPTTRPSIKLGDNPLDNQQGGNQGGAGGQGE